MNHARSRLIALVVLLVLAGGCAGAVRVHRADIREVHRDLTRSVLTTGELSEHTHNLLHRWGQVDAYRTRPDEVLTFLHERVVAGAEGPDGVFALAELSFHHGEHGHKGPGERWQRTSHFLASAIYAYAFLFPDDVAEVPNRFDPRVRIAADLYNRGVTLGLPASGDTKVAIAADRLPLPFGSIELRFDEASLRWGDRKLVDFIAAAELEVHGLSERYRRPGLGVPLAAGTAPLDPAHEPEDFVDPKTRVPMTSILRIPEPRKQLGA